MAAGMTSLVAVLFLTLTTVQTTTEARPNIVFILADDLLYLYLPTENTDGLYSAGWNDVSFHGSNQIPTPNIDSLAYSGIILNNYYVSPICTPTRSALMTGRHPIHTGLQHGVLVGAAPYGLPLSETIMPEYLKPLGYASHIVGKWHLGFYAKEVTPTYRGFDSHFGYWLGAEDYFDHVAQANLATSGLDFRRDMELVRNATNQYSTELFSSEAVKIIHQHNQSQPLFLYLPYQSVHSGNVYNRLQAPEKYVRRFPYIKNPARKIYAGMVSALDDGIGEVVKALKDTDMYKNSIIVFSTDNGGPANGFDGNAASNWPLRGMKNTLWEGGVRGTGFIHSSLLQKSAYLSEQMIHVCDWLPTLYRAAGGDPSILKNLDGFDLWDMLSSNGSSVRNELLHNIDPIGKFAAIRIGDYKLLQGKVSSHSDWYPPYQLQLDDDKTLRFESDASDQQKFSKRNAWSYSEKPVVVNCGRRPANASTNCNADNTPCLFHIPSDPCEYHNLASSRPDVLQDLLAWLEKYRATMVPPLNKPDDPAGNPKLHNGAWTPWINLKAAGL